MRKSPVTFEEAKQSNDPSVRQAYLNGIDLKETKLFIEAVIYRPSMTNRMRTTRHWSHEEDAEPAVVSVGPPAFSGSAHEDDFLSSLIDHEGVHAKHTYNQTEWTRRCMLRCFGDTQRRQIALEECLACRNQLRKHESGDRNLSPERLEEIKRYLEENKAILADYSAKHRKTKA